MKDEGMHASRTGWDEILRENKDFFQKNPYAEIVLSEMSDRKYLRRNDKILKCLIKAVFIPLAGLFNSLIKKVENRKEEGILISYLDRDNDWGLVWPVALQLERKGMYYYFFVDEKIYWAHKKELGSLMYATVLQTDRLGGRRNAVLKLQDLRLVFCDARTINKIICKYNLGNYLEYISIFLSLLALSNGLRRKFFSRCSFSYSLGNRIFGFLYQKYGIKHFAMQHGEHNQGSLREWSALTKANVYLAFTYGSVHERLFHKGYGTEACAVGSMLMRNYPPKIHGKNRIVYFTDMANIATNQYYDRLIKESLDEFVELYKRNKGIAKFCIKIHPNDSEEYFRDYNKLFGTEINIETSKTSAIEVLRSTDICISLGSTVNLQAIRMGVLAVQLLRDWDIFLPQEYSYQVRSLKEIDLFIADIKLKEHVMEKQMQLIEEYDKSIKYPEKEIVRIIMEKAEICGIIGN